MADPIIEFLQKKRKERGISQSYLEFSEGLFVRSTLSGWERGVKSPRLSDLRRYAEYLGYEICLRKRSDV